MTLNFLKNSLLYKVIFPLVIVLVVSFIMLTIAVILMQNRLLLSMESKVGQAISNNNTEMVQSFEEIGKTLKDRLMMMEDVVSQTLTKATQEQLLKEKEQINKAWSTVLKENAESTASLLAQVAPSAILSRNLMELISYARSVSKNSDVVYAMYIQPDGKPYIRFFDRKKPKIIQYLKTGPGKRSYEKIQGASKDDSSVFLVEKPIRLENQNLGKVILCISKASMNEKIGRLSDRFNEMIDRNTQSIETTMEEQHKNVNEAITQIFTATADKNHALGKSALNTIKESIENVRSKTKRVVSVMGSLCGIMVLLSSSLMIIFFFIKPLKKVVERLEDIAQGEGDLTLRLHVKTKDELGELSRYFNLFVDKLQQMINSISQKSKLLNESSTELFSISQKMSEHTEEMSKNSDIISTNAKTMSNNMSSVSGNSEESSENVNMVATSIEEMTVTINEIAENSERARSVANQAVEKTQHASGKISELGNSAFEISKVTEVITEISEQTNLLALNATIEAARAGEYGKGFAVVANEIKELAKQTSDSTQDIKSKIADIQTASQNTVTEIEQVSSVIGNVDEITNTIASSVEEQAVATKEIAININSASEAMQKVNHEVLDSSQVSEKMANDISKMDQTAKDITSNSLVVRNSAGNLSELSSELKQIIGGFKF